ncbi:ferritin family protein [Telmatospirillum sp.]|uniref:ferritin-like domain-containing protein n=1 Tax=Telmatospirillum sp. TaxID=2079197 RepID=UPI002850FC54|nr:ferritin family protein [Telmatospirillum sp.]MDR3439216.1 ferritin family protein [Telmatospirillum sp.]
MSEVAIFLAHAVALEAEAAERYDELADAMEVHNNPEVAAMFRKQAHFSRLHLAEVQGTVKDVELPKLKPWEYQWQSAEGPESAPVERTHYLMTPYHCIHLALQNERRGHQYYADVAYKSQDPDVRRLATEFAAEESQHVVMLEKMAATVEEPEPDWDLDLDPPVVSD